MSAKTRFETPFSFWKLECCAVMCFAKNCKWALDVQLHTGQLTTEIFRTSPGRKKHVAMFPWLHMSCFFLNIGSPERLENYRAGTAVCDT